MKIRYFLASLVSISVVAAVARAGTVLSGTNNSAAGTDAVVSGGANNDADGDYSIVGGGNSNLASDDYTTVAGGQSNEANFDWSFIGGGLQNTTEGNYSAIVGGVLNVTLGGGAFVGGGSQNEAAGELSMVVGGFSNNADGDYSLAAGRRADAGFDGSFVWADSTDADFSAERANQFRVRANGGARFDDGSEWVDIRDDSSNLISTSTGAVLTLGGAWTNSSDRNLKEGLEAVNGRAVLAKVVELPIATWNYKAEGTEVRHMGPMAQDFYAAFGLGHSETRISTIDADGVAFAAIQGLHEVQTDHAIEIGKLQVQVHELLAELESLRARKVAYGGALGMPMLACIGLLGWVAVGARARRSRIMS